MRKRTSRRKNKLSKHIQGLFEREIENWLRCCEMYIINSLFLTVKNKKKLKCNIWEKISYIVCKNEK